MSCPLAVALAEFRPSYKRAAVMQVILAVIGVVEALVAYYFGRGTSTLVAAIVLATVIPWTLIVIMPVNRQLLDETRTSETPGTDVLLNKWGKLHNVRTIASMLALVILAGNILGFI